MEKLEPGTLVATTKKLKGNCGMFIVPANTIAEVVEYFEKQGIIEIVVTPHVKGFITAYIEDVRELTCTERFIAACRFKQVPKYTFEPATLD